MTDRTRADHRMPYLTVFSAPKSFTDPHIDTIQRNAILSWKNLGPEVEVFLVGDEPGMAQAALECDVPVLTEVRRNESGTPLVSSIFELARHASRSPYLVYVNGDILLLPDLVESVRSVAAGMDHNHRQDAVSDRYSGTSELNSAEVLSSLRQKYPAEGHFLVIGQRWDLEVREHLDFSAGWQTRLKERALTDGQLHAPAGSDYFIFPRSAFTDMPDFAIGRAGWDNWMIFEARRCSWPVIDGTPSLMVIHQSHDYSHLPGGRPHYDQPESQQNMQMGGGLKHMYMVLDADRQLRGGKIQRPRLTWLRLIRSVERRLMPESGELRGLRGELTRRLRKLRRRLGREA